MNYSNTLLRRDLFSSVLKGLNLLVDTKSVRGDRLAIQFGYRDLLIRVKRHDGHTTLHILKYMLDVLQIEYHVKNSHHYHTFKMRACKLRIDHFSCASSVMIGYFELLSNFDLKFREKFSVFQLLTGWVKLVRQTDYTTYAKLVKYMCAYPMSRMLHNDPPEKVSGYKGSPLVFTGKVASYIRQRIISNNPKNRKLLFSILQLKRCALKMPSEFVFDALKKHRDLITRPCKSITEQYYQLFKEKLAIVLEKMEIEKFSSFSKIHQFSNSACYEHARSKGGSSNYLHRVVKDDLSNQFGRAKLPPTIENCFYEFIYSNYGELELNKMTHTPLQGVREWHMTMDWKNKDVFTFLDSHPLHDPFTPTNPEDDLKCFARVAAVEEPLKIRTVTCGEAVPYSLSTGLQKDLHKSLKRFPQFSLIGEEFVPRHISWLFSKDPLLSRRYDNIEEFNTLNSSYGFVSGDYTSATDTLNINLSKLIIEQIIFRGKAYHGWNSAYCNMVRSVIYEHNLEYPETKDSRGVSQYIDSTTQSNGQLMGSPLSFPLLCIINLIHYWIKVNPDSSFDNLPVLVNGDDILFYTSAEKYNSWANSLWEPGFEMSLGKNYFSNKVFTINTRMFYGFTGYTYSGLLHFDFRQEDYYQVGKLLGKSKVESPYSSQFKPVWCLQPDVISGSFNPEHAWSRFNYYHRDKLNKIAKNGKYNFYISPYLGGLGMTLPESVKIFTDRKKFSNYKGYKTFLSEDHHRFSSFMFYYKRNWYYDPFHSGKFGIRNDGDKYVLPLPLQDRKNGLSPFSESFIPDYWTKLKMLGEPQNFDELTLLECTEEPGEYNLFYSRGKLLDDNNFSFYDTDIPRHRFRYFKDLISPDLLIRARFEKVCRMSKFQLQRLSPDDLRLFLEKLRIFSKEDSNIRYYSIIQDLVLDNILPYDDELVLELLTSE